MKELDSQAAQLDRLTPPDDLREKQSNVVSAFHAARDAYASQNETSQPDSAFVQTFRAAANAEKAWEDGLSAHYDVHFYKNLGQAMEPALRDGDTLGVRAIQGPVERWQLLLFTFPLDPSRQFIKRVVGLPGETVEVRDGDILINGSPVEGDNYALAAPDYIYAAKTIPSDSYFVLGDNRRNSYDSHAWHLQCPGRECDFVPTDKTLGWAPADTRGGCSQIVRGNS